MMLRRLIVLAFGLFFTALGGYLTGLPYYGGRGLIDYAFVPVGAVMLFVGLRSLYFALLVKDRNLGKWF